jgi:hypothetical protein
MPKLKGDVNNLDLVRLPYRFKFQDTFNGPCTKWLEMIETMCNEILGNYTKKEDQLMTAAFGNREKQRLNEVVDALGFDYLDYKKFFEEEVDGIKRKRTVYIIKRQTERSVKEDKVRKMASKNERELMRVNLHSRRQNPLLLRS